MPCIGEKFVKTGGKFWLACREIKTFFPGLLTIFFWILSFYHNWSCHHLMWVTSVMSYNHVIHVHLIYLWTTMFLNVFLIELIMCTCILCVTVWDSMCCSQCTSWVVVHHFVVQLNWSSEEVEVLLKFWRNWSGYLFLHLVCFWRGAKCLVDSDTYSKYLLEILKYSDKQKYSIECSKYLLEILKYSDKAKILNWV